MSLTKTSVGIQRTTNGSSRSRVQMTLRGAGRVLRSQIWLWPLLAAVFLGLIGWWVQRSIEISMQRHFEGQLQALQSVGVAALESWLHVVEEDAAERARDREVRGGTIELADIAAAKPADLDRQLRDSPYYDRVQKSVLDKIKANGFDEFFIADVNGTLMITGDNQLIGTTLSGENLDFVRRVAADGPLVSRPFKSLRAILGPDGTYRSGVPVMFTAAPIFSAENKAIGVIALRMRPEGEFSRLLMTAKFGDTGETYAFDAKGIMLSQSRFDDDLKRVGILADRPEETSVLNLELRDPGVNMMTGARPTKSRSEMPLTRMAQDAAEGVSGVNVDGYPDYRGVPSIAAWTWLKKYGLGLATKVDYDEAYAPVMIVRKFIWFLLFLLALGAVAIYIFMIVLARQQRELQKVALGAKKLGQYSLDEKIGSGGMGTVYRARHRYLRRPTAVKLLDPEKLSDTAIARFEREVQLTAQLTHPNTIAIYDYGRTDEGLFYYVMELLEGVNLDDLVRQSGPQPAARVVRILEQVCGSLAEAHAKGLAHRDIKPANLYLTIRGGVLDFVKVLDFGLAKNVTGTKDANVTVGSSLTGTPLYLAPETIEHPDQSDARSDIYAIGAVAYFLLTGHSVFRSGTIMDLLNAHMHETPQLPSERLGKPIDEDLERLVMRCLAKDPNDRPADGAALMEQLMICEIAVPWTGSDARAWWQARIPHTQPTQEVTGTARVTLDQTIALGTATLQN